MTQKGYVLVNDFGGHRDWGVFYVTLE